MRECKRVTYQVTYQVTYAPCQVTSAHAMSAHASKSPIRHVKSHQHTPASHIRTHQQVTSEHASKSHQNTPTSHIRTRQQVTSAHASKSHQHTPASHIRTRQHTSPMRLHMPDESHSVMLSDARHSCKCRDRPHCNMNSSNTNNTMPMQEVEPIQATNQTLHCRELSRAARVKI